MLIDKLNDQIKEALRGKDEVRTSTLRLLLSALKYEEIAKQRKLTEEEEITIVRRQLKQREEAVDSYDKAGRLESAEKERKEGEILREFLPAQMGEEELAGIVEKIIQETGASSKDFGKVMRDVMAKVQGKANGKMVAEIVKKKLS